MFLVPSQKVYCEFSKFCAFYKLPLAHVLSRKELLKRKKSAQQLSESQSSNGEKFAIFNLYIMNGGCTNQIRSDRDLEKS